MRILKAVLAGFLVASALILAGQWAFSLLAGTAVRGAYYVTSPMAALVALLYTGAAIVLGAYVAIRIQDSSQTMSGFVIAQAFFGFGLIREFWNSGSSWYGVAAVIIVIPCAIIGHQLARRFGRNRMVRAT